MKRTRDDDGDSPNKRRNFLGKDFREGPQNDDDFDDKRQMDDTGKAETCARWLDTDPTTTKRDIGVVDRERKKKAKTVDDDDHDDEEESCALWLDPSLLPVVTKTADDEDDDEADWDEEQSVIHDLNKDERVNHMLEQVDGLEQKNIKSITPCQNSTSIFMVYLHTGVPCKIAKRTHSSPAAKIYYVVNLLHGTHRHVCTATVKASVKSCIPPMTSRTLRRWILGRTR